MLSNMNKSSNENEVTTNMKKDNEIENSSDHVSTENKLSDTTINNLASESSDEPGIAIFIF